jgi:hypothetical protein
MQNLNSDEEDNYKEIYDVVGFSITPAGLPFTNLTQWLASDIPSEFARSMTRDRGKFALAYLNAMHDQDPFRELTSVVIKDAECMKNIVEKLNDEDIYRLQAAIEQSIRDGIKNLIESASQKGFYYEVDLVNSIEPVLVNNIDEVFNDKEDSESFSWYLAREWTSQIHEHTILKIRVPPIWKWEP